MIKKIKRRFITIFMLSVFVVLAVIITSINLINVINMDRNTTSTLNYIAENNGVFAAVTDKGEIQYINLLGESKYYAESSYKTRFFIVQFSPEMEVVDINTSHIAAVSNETAVSYATKAVESGEGIGYANQIYKFLVHRTESKITVYYVDINQELSAAASFMSVSYAMTVISYILLTIIAFFASGRILKPFVDSYTKQKQFVTDAGHELKTPLAIISANADVLELTYGENEWITSIHNQTHRMDELVKNLLVLAKTDESSEKIEFSDFNLSDLTEAVASSFETVAECANKKLVTSIQPDISFYGNAKNIGQLIGLLTDNAVKYASEGGTVTVRLSRKNKSIVLETENPVPADYKFDGERLFDRFYRSDHSRSRDTGGYGIGLSIAKAVVKLHKGTIAAECKNNTVKFTVTF